MKTIISIIATLVFSQTAVAQVNTNPNAVHTPQKQRIAFRAPASASKYLQQHVIDVGDVPGHQIRVFELQRTYGPSDGKPIASATPTAAGASRASSEAPVFNGVKATESSTRGVSDYTDANGRVYGYTIYTLENGDKIFSRYEGVVLTPAGGKTNANYVSTFVGGTGQFRNIRGVLRGTSVVTFSGGKAGPIETQYEGEYWVE